EVPDHQARRSLLVHRERELAPVTGGRKSFDVPVLGVEVLERVGGDVDLCDGRELSAFVGDAVDALSRLVEDWRVEGGVTFVGGQPLGVLVPEVQEEEVMVERSVSDLK